MRKISQKIAEAFKARKPATLANTCTDGNAFHLHGNKIAEWRGLCKCRHCGWEDSCRAVGQTTCPKCLTQSPEFHPNELWITTAGWDTSTTRERLNAILWLIVPGSRVHRKAGNLHLNNKAWDGSWVKVL